MTITAITIMKIAMVLVMVGIIILRITMTIYNDNGADDDNSGVTCNGDSNNVNDDNGNSDNRNVNSSGKTSVTVIKMPDIMHNVEMLVRAC